jgi:hypothetical protein
VSDTSRIRFPFSLLYFWFMRILPAWSGIALTLFLIQIAQAGIVHDNEKVRALLQFIDVLPPIVKAALGGDMLRAGNVAGLLLIAYEHPFVLFLFMLFAVGVPTGLLAGEVQRGTMELILSRCATKTQVYICAGLLTVTGMFALVMVMFLGTVAAVTWYDFKGQVPLDLFFRIAINGGLLASTFGAFALLCAASFGRLYAAVGASVAFLVANYFISLVSKWWPAMASLRSATLFHLAGGPQLATGWPVHDMALLAAILLAAAVVGGIIWHRRDLPL